MAEEWRPIPGKGDKYSASSLGRIRNNHTGTILSYGYNKDGYRTVTLPYGGKSGSTLAHLAIALTFHGERPHGWHTRHLDSNKENNAPSNLKYGTVLDNILDSHRMGKFKNPPLTERKRVMIGRLLREGLPQVVIAQRLGLAPQLIHREKKRIDRKNLTS